MRMTDPIELTPEDLVPLPMDDRSETPVQLHERVNAAYQTIKYLMDHGLPTVNITNEDKAAAREIVKEHATGRPAPVIH